MNVSEQLSIINRYMESAPVDVIGMADAIGVACHSAYLEDDISGMLERVSEGVYKCTYNASHPMTRQRFTVAHEIGHYMLHRKLLGDGVDDNRAYRSTDAGKYHNTAIGPKQETEANRFAAAVLMPTNLVKQKIAEDCDISDNDLSRVFKVSMQAMTIRRKGLGC